MIRATSLICLAAIAGCSDRNKGKPATPELRDVLAAWEKRFASVPPGASDAQVSSVTEEESKPLLELFELVANSGRATARLARSARQDLQRQPDKAIPVLASFVRRDDCTREAARAGFALFEGTPLLATASMQWLDDANERLRIHSAWALGKSGSAHAIPKLLRRLKYELDQPADFTIEVCAALAELGNPSGVPALVRALGKPQHREAAGAALVRILDLWGPPYEEADGWTGLERKARGVLARFRERGELPFREGHDPAAKPDELAERELWLFLRHLGGEPLRPVDEARFVALHAGALSVKLLDEALLDKQHYVRVHTLEVVSKLGAPARRTGPRVRALTRDSMCRTYALEALGSVGDDSALDTLGKLVLLGFETPRERASPDDLVAALKGLRRLGDAEALPVLLRTLRTTKSDDIRVWAAAAIDGCASRARREGRAALEKMLAEDRYHAPTLRELLDK